MKSHTKANTSQILSPAELAPNLNGRVPNISKVEKYKWGCKDKPGEFAMISKSELLIDHQYQRTPRSEEAVLRLARDWSWVACGTLTVVERDNQWFVVDGQHRKLAADKREDIQNLPCMVFESYSSHGEADSFLTINTQRSAVTGLNKYHAALWATDTAAVKLDAMIRGSGLQVGAAGSEKTVACVMTLWAFAKEDWVKLEKLWPLLVHMHHGSEIFNTVVKGVWLVEQMFNSQSNGKKTLINEPYFSKLVKIGGKACNQESNRLAIERGKGGQAVMRDAILNCLKKKI